MGQNTSKSNNNNSGSETPENLPYSPSESVHSIQDIRKYRPNIKPSRFNYIDNLRSSLENYRNMSKVHRNNANKFMNKGDFKTAIEEYTKAIMCYDRDSKYYSNRAFCYKNLFDWEKMIADSRVALALDKENERAFDLLAVGLIESERLTVNSFTKTEEGIRLFEHVIKLCQMKKKDPGIDKFFNEVMIRLKKAKKLFWLKRKKYREAKIQSTNKMILQLIDESGEEKNLSISKDIVDLVKLENNDHDISEIPDYFLCKINYEPLKSPVLTMDGITYEKQTLMEHFIKVGYFDPLTRRDLDNLRIIENRNLVEAFDYFIEKNPWAFDFVDRDEKNNDFMSIEL